MTQENRTYPSVGVGRNVSATTGTLLAAAAAAVTVAVMRWCAAHVIDAMREKRAAPAPQRAPYPARIPLTQTDLPIYMFEMKWKQFNGFTTRTLYDPLSRCANTYYNLRFNLK